MSLKEKLAGISQNLQEEKKIEEQSAQEKELAPIRTKIKELEEQKRELDLIKGSLELKSDGKIGKGMKEYSSETAGNIEKESIEINTLINENKEALQSLGVEDKEQLMTNPETAEGEEVVRYKKAEKQSEDLRMSDKALQKKLASLGIEVDQEKFSYDSAEKALAEKIQLVEGELVKEKLKTPEGKEENLEMAMGDLEKSLPAPRISKESSRSGYDQYVFSMKDTKVFYGYDDIQGSKKIANFKGLRNHLLPDNFKDLELKYGKDIAQEAIVKVYENKFDQSQKKFDEEIEKAKSDFNRISEQRQKGGMQETQRFQKVKDIMEKEIPEAEKKILKEKIMQKINTELELQFAVDKFKEEAKKEGFAEIYQADNELKKIKESKEEAKEMLIEFKSFEMKLPKDEDLVLEGVHVKIPSIGKKIEDLKLQIKDKKENLNQITEKITKKTSEKPPLFGRKAWEENLKGELRDLNLEKERLVNEIKNMENKEMTELSNNQYVRFPIERFYYLKDILRESNGATGKADSIFSNIKNKLEEIKQKKVPEELVKLSENYKKLFKESSENV